MEEACYRHLVHYCGEVGSLSLGRRVHVHIRKHSNRSAFLAPLLIQMYGRCSSPREAAALFQALACPDTSSWNAIISASAQNGHHLQALSLYTLMLQQVAPLLKPNKFTFLPLLSSCAALSDYATGKKIHILLVSRSNSSSSGSQSDPPPDPVLPTALLHMYGRCGRLKEARCAFNRIRNRTVVTWNSMISAYSRHGFGQEALDLFQQMLEVETVPSKVTFLSLFHACSSLTSLEKAREIHKCLLSSSVPVDTPLKNSLLHMYGKCGGLTEAELVFDSITDKDCVSWNAMLGGLAQQGHSSKAIRLLQKMDMEGMKPDSITFLHLLNACANHPSLPSGKLIHCRIALTEFCSNPSLKNSLLTMYGKCGRLTDAGLIFKGVEEHGLVSWNSMLSIYAQNGHGIEALQLFEKMEEKGVKPDKVTFICLFNACANLASLEYGRFIHKYMRNSCSGFELNVGVNNALLSMYGKCGNLLEAREVFDSMRERDIISWNAMIVAYAQNGHGEEGLELFFRMDLEGILWDKVTFLCILNTCISESTTKLIHECIVCSGFDSEMTIMTALLDVYGKCGCHKEACMVFNTIDKRDTHLWTAMLSSCARNGHGIEAFNLYQQMGLEGAKPNKVTYICLLNACAGSVSLETGRGIHKSALADGFASDVDVRNALLNMYGKCGSLTDMWAIFDVMQRGDQIPWNSIIGAHAQNGHGKSALGFFLQMDLEGVRSDKVTFLCVLNACCHAGLMDEGWYYFVSMVDDYNKLTPSQDHYVCIIDLLSRAGSLNEAEDMTKNMPVEIDEVAWTALLGFSKPTTMCCEQFDA